MDKIFFDCSAEDRDNGVEILTHIRSIGSWDDDPDFVFAMPEQVPTSEIPIEFNPFVCFLMKHWLQSL